MEDRCLCCGKIIPEGRQVYWHCENTVFSDEKAGWTEGERNLEHKKKILSEYLRIRRKINMGPKSIRTVVKNHVF